MGQARHGLKFSAAVLAISGATATAADSPPPAAILKFQPKQPGVVCAMPTEAEAAAYKVELVNGPGTASGWALKDAKGQLVRKFVSSKGAKATIDVWSYYLDGHEVYREIDSKGGANKPNEFRYFGINGLRWGVDVNGDTKIDGWKMISAEEVSQEVLKAIITKDVARFQALLINATELGSLKLDPAETTRLQQSVAAAAQKFQQTCTSFGLNEQTQWLQLQVQPPQCLPGDATGKPDVVRYASAAMLYQNGTKADFITLGDLVQVGMAWRLTAAPTAGMSETGPTSTDPVSPSTQKLINELTAFDQKAPPLTAAHDKIGQFNLERAALVEQIANGMQGQMRESWIKQLSDSLGTAVQYAPAGNKVAQIKLVALHDKLAKEQPGGALAGYVKFREIQATNNVMTGGTKSNDDHIKGQEALREQLKQFVQAYPTAEDAPDAALQVGIISETLSKEADAKTAYSLAAQQYGNTAAGQKATGALRRLDIKGKPVQLAGTTINGQNLNIGQYQGKKHVVVVYWASWINNCNMELAGLDALAKGYAAKDVVVVLINLDNEQKHGAVQAMLTQTPVTGDHIFAGGAESPLAAQYGISVVPSFLIIDKNGMGAAQTVQKSVVEDELKKLTDK